MALRIVNNLAAMNTQRWLGVADTGMKKSLERLSSGYRINKAADDAAGLAISQAFRANIASFKVASRNTSEAAALLQVAEGGMDQIGNMLTRLKELATQAASANVGASERTKIDAEGDALLSEIDRIANSSKYGSTSLLDGTFGATQTGTPGAVTDEKIFSSSWTRYDINTANAALSGATVVGLESGFTEGTWYLGINTAANDDLYLMNAAAFSDATITEKYNAASISTANSAVAFDNIGLTLSITGSITSMGGYSGAGDAFVVKRTGLTSLNVENAAIATYHFTGASANELKLGNGTITETITNVNAGESVSFDKLGITFTVSTLYTEDDLEGMTLTVEASGSSGNTFQIGAENNSDNQISISVSGTRKSDLGLTNLDLATTTNAQQALTMIDTAIGSLAGSRGDIGASMNRLSYASANLATTIENQQAAESVIRDVDMANEMTNFTKNQILLQAGTAMLAQANMAPQQVLALFG